MDQHNKSKYVHALFHRLLWFRWREIERFSELLIESHHVIINHYCFLLFHYSFVWLQTLFAFKPNDFFFIYLICGLFHAKSNTINPITD